MDGQNYTAARWLTPPANLGKSGLKSRTPRGKQLFLGGFDYGRKSGRFVDGQFGQDFAVQGNVGLFEAGDQLAVGSAIETGAGVDTGIPELAESAFAVLAVASGELQRFGDGLAATLDADPVGVAEAFSGFTDLFVLGVTSDTSFYSDDLLLKRPF